MQRPPAPMHRGRSVGSMLPSSPAVFVEDEPLSTSAGTLPDAPTFASSTPRPIPAAMGGARSPSHLDAISAHGSPSPADGDSDRISGSPDELRSLPAYKPRPNGHAGAHGHHKHHMHRDFSLGDAPTSKPAAGGHRRSRSDVPVGTMGARQSRGSASPTPQTPGGGSRPGSYIGGLFSLFGMRKSDNDLLGTSSSAGTSPDAANQKDVLVLESRPRNLPPKDPAEAERQQREYDLMVSEAKRRADKEQKTRLARQDEKDRLVAYALQQWSAVLPQFEVHRRTKKLRDLWWQGLPPSLRGRVWALAIGNDLHITKELFEIFLTHARNKLQATTEDDYYGSSSGSGAPPTTPPPSRARPGGNTPSEASSDADKLSQGSVTGGAVLGRESSVHLICLDVSRTFPSLGIFQGGGPYYDSLRSVLEAYVCYRPDVGYVQGMSFLASMLLLNMDVVDAFACLANLLNKPLHMAFFRMDMGLMQPYLSTLMSLMEQTLPSLHAHMVKLKINPDFYMIDWILTLFSKALPLDVASRVWDVFMCYGDVFVFRAALGIFRLYLDELLSMEFEEAMEFITHLPQDMSDVALFGAIAQIQVTDKQYADTLAFERARVAKANASSKGSSTDSISLLGK